MSPVTRKPIWDLKIEVILSDGRRLTHREQVRALTMDEAMDRDFNSPEVGLSKADRHLAIGFHMSVNKRV